VACGQIAAKLVGDCLPCSSKREDRQLNKGYYAVTICRHNVMMDGTSDQEWTNLLVVRKCLACPNIELMLFYF